MLIFSQNVNKNKLKDFFKALVDLAVFQQLRKLWKGGGPQFTLFLSLFLYAHINFQYKLKSHTSLFIVTFQLFSSIALLTYSHLHFSCFSLILYDKFNMCK